MTPTPKCCPHSTSLPPVTKVVTGPAQFWPGGKFFWKNTLYSDIGLWSPWSTSLMEGSHFYLISLMPSWVFSCHHCWSPLTLNSKSKPEAIHTSFLCVLTRLFCLPQSPFLSPMHEGKYLALWFLWEFTAWRMARKPEGEKRLPASLFPVSFYHHLSTTENSNPPQGYTQINMLKFIFSCAYVSLGYMHMS